MWYGFTHFRAYPRDYDVIAYLHKKCTKDK